MGSLVCHFTKTDCYNETPLILSRCHDPAETVCRVGVEFTKEWQWSIIVDVKDARYDVTASISITLHQNLIIKPSRVIAVELQENITINSKILKKHTGNVMKHHLYINWSIYCQIHNGPVWLYTWFYKVVFYHYDVRWVLWQLKSMVTWLFVQQLALANRKNKNMLETCKNPWPTSGWSELTKSCTTSTMNFHMAYFSRIPQNNPRLKLSCKFGESKCNPYWHITLMTSHGMNYVLNEHLDFGQHDPYAIPSVIILWYS